MLCENYSEMLEERKQELLPVVLTPTEAMDILGVGKNTIYHLLNTGQLRGIRIGRVWRINYEEIEKFLKI